MSALSTQCDELRAMAESVGLAMPQAATLMMGAADAIDHLDAENAKLRELVSDSASLLDATCDTYYESDYHAIIERARELGVEVD